MRIQAIGRALPPLDLDVLALQEVWDDSVAAPLTEAGRAAGLIHSWNGQARTGGSGLLLLSRLPIVESRFEAYRTRGLPQRVWHGDYWGGKGFGELALETGAGQLALYLTHLHAQYDWDAYPEYRLHRLGQVVQLAARVHEQARPVVALGDFNHREDDVDHLVLRGLTGLADAAVVLNHRQATVLASNPYVREQGGTDSRIDYVLYRSPRLALRGVRRAFDAELDFEGRALALSDHAGVIADFTLDPARSGGAVSPNGFTPTREAVALARAGIAEGRADASARRQTLRSQAAAGTAAFGLSLAARRLPAPSRRVLLRALLAIAAAAAPLALGSAWLSEITATDEFEAFDAIEQLLDGIENTTIRLG
jgi:endonuclease/exonuclease/phosphatase family metal-dependent hydrolase